MSKRLQVLLDDEEYSAIQRAAARHRLTVSEWVRQSLARQQRTEPTIDMKRKLEAIRAAAAHRDGPAVDIEQMLAEIERGYLGETEGNT